jgi:hypothetical protein
MLPSDGDKAKALAVVLDAGARSHGRIVVRFYERGDGYRMRPRLAVLRARAAAGAFDIVWVNALAELAGNPVGALRVARELDACAVRIVSGREPWFDVHNPLVDLLVAAERRHFDRSAKAIEAKRSRLERVGEVPYGYHCPDGLNVEPSPQEQAVIAVVLELARDGWSRRRIAQQVYDRGYRSRRGTAIGHGLIGSIIRRRAATPEEPAH